MTTGGNNSRESPSPKVRPSNTHAVQTLIALNPTDGESLWETPIYENDNSTPNTDTPEQFVGIGHSLVVNAPVSMVTPNQPAKHTWQPSNKM